MGGRSSSVVRCLTSKKGHQIVENNSRMVEWILQISNMWSYRHNRHVLNRMKFTVNICHKTNQIVEKIKKFKKRNEKRKNKKILLWLIDLWLIDSWLIRLMNKLISFKRHICGSSLYENPDGFLGRYAYSNEEKIGPQGPGIIDGDNSILRDLLCCQHGESRWCSGYHAWLETRRRGFSGSSPSRGIQPFFSEEYVEREKEKQIPTHLHIRSLSLSHSWFFMEDGHLV